MSSCLNCGRIPPQHHNYCNWDCHVAHAVKEGATFRLPNGLPPRCITASGLILECEHGDHPTYMFPVVADYTGSDAEEAFGMVDGEGNKVAVGADWIEAQSHETHALIYTDGSIALTLYECGYFIFSVKNGKLVRGPGWAKAEWKLSDESLDRIRGVGR